MGGIRRASVSQEPARLHRRARDVADHVHLHGYDMLRDVAPGRPAQISFRATIPGRFEVELEDRGLQILDLRCDREPGAGARDRRRAGTCRSRCGSSSTAPASSWSSRSSRSARSGGARCSRARGRGRPLAAVGAAHPARHRAPRSWSGSSRSALLGIVLWAAAFGEDSVGGQPRADLRLRRLLARPRARRRAVRQRLVGAQPVEGGRGRRRRGSGAGSGWRGSRRSATPSALGRWPAAVLLLAFATLELAYPDSSSPRTLAFAVALYTLDHVDRDGRVRAPRVARERRGVRRLLRPARADRAVRRARRPVVVRCRSSGSRAPRRAAGHASPFVAVMLGSVAFDGFSRTTWWQERLYSIDASLALDAPAPGRPRADAASTCSAWSRRSRSSRSSTSRAVECARVVSGRQQALADEFIGSLVPIALAYAVAHYFSLFVLQGQVTRRLVSDPFGYGWDLFGTARLPARPDRADAEHDLVRPGRRARRRPRARPRARARPRRRALPLARYRAADAVRDARADGRLHRRRALAAFTRLARRAGATWAKSASRGSVASTELGALPVRAALAICGPVPRHLKGRDFLRIADWSGDELTTARPGGRAEGAHGDGEAARLLPGRTLGMIFQKPSTRTRVSFEVGITQLGGTALYLVDRRPPARPRRDDPRHGAPCSRATSTRS